MYDKTVPNLKMQWILWGILKRSKFQKKNLSILFFRQEKMLQIFYWFIFGVFNQTTLNPHTTVASKNIDVFIINLLFQAVVLRRPYDRPRKIK